MIEIIAEVNRINRHITKKIRELMLENHVDYRDIAMTTPVTQQKVYEILGDQCFLEREHIIWFCNYFKTNLEELVKDYK